MTREKKNLTLPRYQEIAVEIAERIVENRYQVGEKIYARSSLASQYGVSAETARRAVAVLQDLEIVETTKGSGVVIISSEKAAAFVHQYGDVQSVQELQNDLLASVAKQREELTELEHTLTQLIERTDRFKATNPFVPFQIVVTEQASHCGANLQTLNFWHNTAATIVGIKNGQEMLLSPGPYATFNVGDTIYFIGNESCFERVKNFLFKN